MLIHFQKTVKKELEKLIESGHLEKADKTTEYCFVSPAVITIKQDKSVDVALDSRKLNEACVNRKAAMPNMEELISKISAEITRSSGEIWMSKIDLDYAYGQAKLTVEAAKHCVFDNWRQFHRPLPIEKGFYGLSDIPTVFQEHVDKVLEFKTPVWLDDIIFVTNETIDEHEREVREVLTKLQNAGYRASDRKTELFKTDKMRRLLKKETRWDWTPEVNKDFKNLKIDITESPCLAYFDPKNNNYVTTDACNTGLEATL